MLTQPPGGVTLRLRPAWPRFPSVPDTPYVRPRMEGFGTLAVPGRPGLPVRRERIALPLGSGAELTVLDLQVREVPVGRIAPAPAVQRGGEGGGQEAPPRLHYREDPAAYAAPGFRPRRFVSLGERGQLRRQQFQELLITPVQYDPTTGMARILVSALVSVDFVSQPPPPDREMVWVPPDVEPVYEATYRAAILNYGQGREFRGDWRWLPGPAPTAVGPRRTLTPPARPAAPPGTYKVEVSRDGIYRLTHAALQAAGVPVGGIDPATFRLTVQGTEVRLSEGGNGDALFEPGEYLEFYGQGMLGEAEAGVFQEGDFTDTNVYWLAWGGGAGLRVTSEDRTPTSGYSVPADWQHTERMEVDTLFLGPVPYDGADHFIQSPLLSQITIGGGKDDCPGSGSKFCKDIAIPLPGLSGDTGNATVRVVLRGRSFTDHHARVRVNGTCYHDSDPACGCGDCGTGTWTGAHTDYDVSFPVPQPSLTDPTTVRVELIDDGVTDSFYRDFFEVTYRREFAAQADELGFAFTGPAEFHLSGFTSSQILLYDVTDPVNPIRCTTGSTTGSGLKFENGLAGSRSYHATHVSAVLSPDQLVADTFVNLMDPAKQVDYILVSHPDVVGNGFAAGPSSSAELEDWITFREGQGYTVERVFIEEVYDEFNDGIADPRALNTFLQYAYDNWEDGGGNPPEAVILIGDASQDGKNVIGHTNPADYVPTRLFDSGTTYSGYYASDTIQAQVAGGDNLPDIYVSRIEARNPTEVDDAFAKINGYLQSPPGGAWTRTGVFISDYDGVLDFDFPQENYAIAQMTTPHTPTRVYYSAAKYQPYHTKLATMRADVISALDAGTVLVSYVGHGGPEVWGKIVFFDGDDVSALAPNTRLPLILNMNCLTGAFYGSSNIPDDPTNNYSLMGRFLKEPGRGAVAAIAPTDTSLSSDDRDFLLPTFETIFDLDHRDFCLGEIDLSYRIQFDAVFNPIQSRAFALFGDPLLELAIPRPEPPTNVGFTGLPATCDLQITWTESVSAVSGYHLYRSLFLNGPYAQINGSLIAPGSSPFTDPSVDNEVTYYYRMEAVDGNGYRSRLTAPLAAVSANPAPPAAPTGVLVTDPESGGRLDVTWNPNAECDFRDYRVYWGTAPGVYANWLQVSGAQTSATIGGLLNGVTHYVAVTAFNDAGLESAYSTEQIEVPTYKGGITPPKFVSTLVVERDPGDGDNLRVTWTPPTQNINGKLTVLLEQRLYRSATPNFRLEDVPPGDVMVLGPAVSSYIDAGKYVDGNDYYYVLTAVDLDGYASGGGFDLPRPVDSLNVVDNGDSTLTLSWPAVTQDYSGNPTTIAEYRVYGGADPSKLKRDFIETCKSGCAGVDLLAVTATLSVVVPEDLAPLYFYEVYVVDVKGNWSPY